MLNPRRPRRAPHLFVAAAAAVALILSGCGSVTVGNKAKTGGQASVTTTAKPVPSAKVLYDQMRKNVTAAQSVRMKGAVTNAGKKLTIDVAGDRDGKNTQAIVNDGAAELELLSVGGDIYIKADAAYWTKNASAAAAKIAADKYVKVPKGSGLMNELSVGALLDGAFKDLPISGAFQKVEETDLGGVPAYLLVDRIGGKDGQIYVSADGKALLMRIVSTKKNAGTLDFTDWDAVPPMTAPPASQQVKVPGFS